jgi:hypothetical protein
MLLDDGLNPVDLDRRLRIAPDVVGGLCPQPICPYVEHVWPRVSMASIRTFSHGPRRSGRPNLRVEVGQPVDRRRS